MASSQGGKTPGYANKLHSIRHASKESYSTRMAKVDCSGCQISSGDMQDAMQGKYLCIHGGNMVAEPRTVFRFSVDFGSVYEIFSHNFHVHKNSNRGKWGHLEPGVPYEPSGCHLRIILLEGARKRKHRNPHIHTTFIPHPAI